MPSSATPPGRVGSRPRRWTRSRRFAVIAILLGAALCMIALGMHRWWPFGQVSVLQNLRQASDSEVKVRTFRQTYFPWPGCIMEGVVFIHGPADAKPLITIEKLAIRGSYGGLLSERISQISAEGLRVFIPPFGTGTTFHTNPSKITTDEIVANGAAIEFASRDPGKEPLRFDVHHALLKNVGWNGALSYQVRVRNPEPPGEVTAEGKFGVWNKVSAGETPISGKYKFEHADLSVYGGIAGTLSSEGKFEGKLARIDISGSTTTPDFEVKSGGHPVRLTSQFKAHVDAIHGDTFLDNVTADFWKTRVVAQGSIATSPDGKGKTAKIDLRSNNARIDDFLKLFVKADRAPMSGSVMWQSRAEIPPGEKPFLEKLKMNGSFGVTGGTFSDPSTQEGVDKLSSGARGEKDHNDPETVLTNLKGQVELLSGKANFSDLSFAVPGAAARMHGSFSLISHKIDLRGQIRVDTKISDTTSGSKALILKMMDPLFKKKPKGEIVPVRISGTYGHPTFGLDLVDDKKAAGAGQR